MRQTLLIAFLFLLLALGYWLLQSANAPGGSELRGESEAAHPQAEGPQLSAGGAAPGKKPPPGDTRGDAPEAFPPPGAGDSTERIFWRGTLRVEGRDDEVRFDPPVKLSVYEYTSPSSSFFGFGQLEVQIESSGPLRIDMTDAIKQMKDRYGHQTVVVRLEHSAYLVTERKIPIPDLAALLSGSAALPDLELVLRPAGHLTGRVLDVDDTPRLGVNVLLYRMTAGVPEERPVAEGDTDLNGRFALRFVSDGSYLLVATWRRLGNLFLRTVESRQPASQILDLLRDVAPEPVELHLRTGRTVRGRIRLDGQVPGLVGLTWRLDAEAPRLLPSKDGSDYWGLAFVDGEASWAWGGTTDFDGDPFAIHGLSERPYRIRVTVLFGIALHARAHHQVEQVVTPPKDDLLFDIRPAFLHVTARTEQGAVAGLAVTLSAVGMAPDLPAEVVWDSHNEQTDTHGEVRIAVLPDCEWALSVGDPRYEPVLRTVRSPGPGETLALVLDLVPAKPRASLVVILEGEGAEDVHRAGFGFYEPGVNPTSRGPTSLRAAVRRKDGRYFLNDLEPGPWRLHVRPDRSWSGKPTAWMEAVADVALPASGQTTVRIPIVRGGRLHLDVTDPDGRYVKAHCTLRSSTGAPVTAVFHGLDLIDGAIISHDTLPGTGACWLEHALPSGAYMLRFELQGHEPQERRVTIRVGDTSLVRLVMKPRH